MRRVRWIGKRRGEEREGEGREESKRGRGRGDYGNTSKWKIKGIVKGFNKHGGSRSRSRRNK